jgi:PAS domain S-box-containing protein
MEPSLAVMGEWLGGLTVAVGFLKVAKVKAFDPTKRFVTRVGRTMDAVEQINAELGTNGGKSIKDRVGRMDRLMALVDARQVALMVALPEPMFWTDIEGDFTLVNRSLEDLTGFSRAHLMDAEWVNIIHPHDRVRIVKEWLGTEDGAVKQLRAWLTTCRLVNPKTGDVTTVRIEAHPIRQTFGDHSIVGWHGVLSVEDPA